VNRMDTIYFPILFLEQWRFYPGDPVKHWETGFSAKSLSHCWFQAQGFPRSVRDAFEKAGNPLAGCEPLLIFPEHKAELPGGNACSQNDLWILARHSNDLLSIAVEGKVGERFGNESVKEWFRNASQQKYDRFAYLTNILEVTISKDSDLHYQLIHRTASAIIEVDRFMAQHAVMLVHSFSPSDAWFDDYRAFVKLWGIEAEKNAIHSRQMKSGKHLYFGWIHGEEEFLKV